jgi:hypothetical protein
MTDFYDQREDLYAANQARAMREQRDGLPGNALDTLAALCRGVREVSQIPSKAGLTVLIERGYAVQVVGGRDAWQSYGATPAGWEAYRNHSAAGKGEQHANDLRTPDAATAMLTLPVLSLPMEVKPQGVADQQHDPRAFAPSVAVMGADGMFRAAPAADCSLSMHCPRAHSLNAHDVPAPALYAAAPPTTALRARLYADGALVIDNPANPLVVRPIAHIDPLDSDPLTFTLHDAGNTEAFVRAAIAQSINKENGQ